MLTINTNLAAQTAATNAGRANEGVRESSERLTTGLRINKAADDVSGAAMANRLETNVNKTAQFIKNANDGVNMIQAADSALQAQQEVVQRMQELAFKAENGTNVADDQALIQKEFDQLAKELVRNAKTAEFNGKPLIDGSLSAAINVGTGANNQIDIAVGATDITGVIAADGTMAMELKSATHADAAAWKAEVHDKLATIAKGYNEQRADLGAAQNRLEFTTTNLENTHSNLTASLSATQDTDFAAETSELAKQKLLAKAGQAMLSQANKAPEEVTQLLR